MITFDFNKSESLGSAGKCGANIPKEQRRYLVDNNLGTVAPLDLKMYDCGYPIPEDGHLDGYPTGPSPTSVLPPVSCTFCDEVCQAPDIDATIHGDIDADADGDIKVQAQRRNVQLESSNRC